MPEVCTFEALTKEDVAGMLAETMKQVSETLDKVDDKLQSNTTTQTTQIQEIALRVTTMATQLHGLQRVIRFVNSTTDSDLKLSDLPEFTGEGVQGDAQAFLEWTRQMEQVFDYKGFDEQKSFVVASLKLTKYAGLWLENLQANRTRAGETRIKTWSELKSHMSDHFLPRAFCQYNFLELNHLKQKNRSAAEYTKEFEKLCMLCDLQEKQEMKIGRYIRGLKLSIRNQLDTSSFKDFEDVKRLAVCHEMQEHEKLKNEEKIEKEMSKLENRLCLLAMVGVLSIIMWIRK